MRRVQAHQADLGLERRRERLQRLAHDLAIHGEAVKNQESMRHGAFRLMPGARLPQAKIWQRVIRVALGLLHAFAAQKPFVAAVRRHALHHASPAEVRHAG